MRINDWHRQAEEYLDIDRAILRQIEENDMERANLSQVITALLACRENLSRAVEALAHAKQDYAEAEDTFLKGAGAVEPGPEAQWPDKVIVGDLVIIAKEEWYDLNKCERLEYHTVKVVPVAEQQSSLYSTLADRIDQLVLLKNLKGEFKSERYWSGEQSAGDAAYAWVQDFGDGDQDCYRKDGYDRCRAVRRVPL